MAPNCIWVRSRNCGCLVTWFCNQLIAKPGNKTAAVSWPDPIVFCLVAMPGVYGTMSSFKADWMIVKCTTWYQFHNYNFMILFWSNTWNYNIIGEKETDQFRLSDAQMYWSSWLVLALILATHLFSAKPQHEAMQTYLHQNPHKHIFVKLSSEFRHFYQRRFENISYKFPSMLSRGQRVPHSFHPPGASLRSRMFQVCWALSQWTARG